MISMNDLSVDSSTDRAFQVVMRILKGAISSKASDIHLKAESAPRVRIEGRLFQLDHPRLPTALVDAGIKSLIEIAGLDPERLNRKQVDFSCNIAGVGRFRVHVYHQKGTRAAALRSIPTPIPDFAALRLPSVIKRIAMLERGLILVTGATGNGKSTTIASLLEYINQNVERHIVTVEQPIEYLFDDNKSYFSQRELGRDIDTMQQGIEGVLREDPDMAFFGEIRTSAEFEMALNAAESGRVVLTTFHSSDAVSTISRMINLYAPEFQDAARNRIADVIGAIIAQKLLPRRNAKTNILVTEVFTRSPTALECIRDPNRLRGLTVALESATSTYGSHSFDQMLKLMVRDDIISLDTAKAAAHNANDFVRSLQLT
jgi:twitching motility protein PilT